jgi:hypothetical protein
MARVDVYDSDGILVKTAMPGEIYFGQRLVKIRALFWDNTGAMEALPEQYLDIFISTTDAHSFNFVAKNLDSGVYTVRILWTAFKSGYVAADGDDLAALVGKRTAVVEEVRMVHD